MNLTRNQADILVAQMIKDKCQEINTFAVKLGSSEISSSSVLTYYELAAQITTKAET